MGRLNLLASKKGRLWAFFLLYVSEGLPLGFAMVAVVSQLRRESIGPAAIGAFIAVLLLPSALKWIGGPIVDAIRSRRFGHRRAWILGCQLPMVAALLALSQLSFAGNIAVVTAIFFVHNLFAALQDVAIDSLAVNVLPEEERGLANGLMLAGMMCGQALGGPAVLFLVGQGSFSNGFLLVAGAVLSIAAFVVLPMREQLPAEVAGEPAPAVGLRGSLTAMRDFSLRSYKALTGSQGAFACLLFCLLPAGALSLNLALKTTLAVELGFSPAGLVQLTLAGSLLAACGTVVGGLLSNRVGKKRLIAFSTVAACIPTLWLMWQLQMHGHVMPTLGKQAANPGLVQALWIAVVAYQFLAYLMIGARFAVFMDVTNPRVAATQFTTYAALNNVGLAMSASWQGKLAEAQGYPTVLAVDVAVGLLGLLILPFVLKPTAAVMAHGDGKESLRTRALAWTLAVACLAWIPVGHLVEFSPAVRGLFTTPFTLAFVAASVFLLVRSAQGERSPWNLALRGAGVLLLLMHAQPYLAGWAANLGIDSALVASAYRALDAISVLGVVALVAAGMQPSRPGQATVVAA
jgi:MFS transporter, PAT family, beta-lactamase induction signal transducer AmpG